MKHLLLGAIAGMVLPLAAAPQLRTAEFQDNGEALINPMMGWMYEFYSDTTGNRYPLPDFTDAADDFPGNSTIYMRIPWSSLEPEEGKFTWNVVDAPAQRWIARGKKIALRFVTSGTGELEYATPKWVFDAGAKKIIVRKNGIDSREVIQDDPVFLAKLENFLRAAAKRYNGNPDVAFLDVAFGTWGEGHTLNSLKLSPEENARQARIHALLYRKHFPDTLLAISDDVIGPTAPGKDFPLMKELRELGITLRDDSVLCTRPATYHGELAQNYWPTMPVVLEHEHLAEAATKKMTWSNFLLLKTIEKYHASYLSIHDWPDSEKRILGPYLDRINRRLGYRIRPVRIDYPAEIEPGKPFSFRTVIGNAGVAPCYPGGFPAFTLKDKKGGIAAVFTDEAHDVRTLAVGRENRLPETEWRSEFRLPERGVQLPAGEYALYFSVGSRIGTPLLALPLANSDGNRRYYVGKVSVKTDYAGSYRLRAHWIWNSVNPHKNGAQTCLVRTFRLEKPCRSAVLRITADDDGEVFVNGRSAAKLEGWSRGREIDLLPLLREGENLVTVRARNIVSFSGVIGEIILTKADGEETVYPTDAKWRGVPACDDAAWTRDPAVSAKWPAAKELYEFGAGPWGRGVKFYR